MIADRVDALDRSLFDGIVTQTLPHDRASLLALQSAVAARHGAFDYLEIGSHLGGSLLPFVLDDRVGAVVSIDLRPEAARDGRRSGVAYAGNSTARMLDNLRGRAGECVAKVQTIDADTRSLDPAAVSVAPRLCFIDGEHTYESCLADARFCRAVAAEETTIVFHDAPIVFGAIAHVLKELRADGIEHAAYPLPARMFVIDIGAATVGGGELLERLLSGYGDELDRLGRMLARRPGLASRRPGRLLLRLWLSPLGTGRDHMRRYAKVRRRRVRKKIRRGIWVVREAVERRLRRGWAAIHTGLRRGE